MPKRKHRDEESDDYIMRKIRKLSKRLRRRRDISSSNSSSDSERDTFEIQNVNNNEVYTFDDFILDTNINNETAASAASINMDIVDKSSEENVQNVSLNVTTTKSDEPLAPQPGTSSTPDQVASSSANENAVVAEPELDQELLDLLGETPSKEKKYGPNIQNDLSVRWNHIAINGLSKESRKEFIDKHNTPENCKLIDAPILNAEAKAALSDALLKKDKSIEQKQTQRAVALSCLGEAITNLLSSGNKDATYIKPLIVAGRLICDLQHNDSMIRRSFVCSTLKKEIKDHLYKTEIDKYLFGEKLSDTLKAAKIINKSGADMKVQSQFKSIAKKQYLNSRTPLPNSRQPEAARRQEPAPGPSRPRPPPPAAAAPQLAPPQRPPQRQQPRSQVFPPRRR